MSPVGCGTIIHWFSGTASPLSVVGRTVISAAFCNTSSIGLLVTMEIHAIPQKCLEKAFSGLGRSC